VDDDYDDQCGLGKGVEGIVGEKRVEVDKWTAVRLGAGIHLLFKGVYHRRICKKEKYKDEMDVSRKK